MSASAAPLKYCVRFYDRNISYITLHAIVKRATPSQIMIYKHALLLHKIYNDENSSQEWLSLFFNQTFNNRAMAANFIDNSKFKVGKNLIENRLTLLNNKINYQMLNQTYESYKIACKNLFIKNTIHS